MSNKCKSKHCLFHTNKQFNGSDVSLDAVTNFIASLNALGNQKSNDEIEKSYVTDLQAAVNACDGINDITNRSKLYYRYPFNFKNEVLTLNICESCKLRLYNNQHKYPRKSTYNDWKRNAKAIKCRDSGHAIVNDYISKIDKKAVKPKYRNAEDVRKFFRKHRLMVPSDDVVCLMCLPDASKYRQCYMWMKEFFDLECQYPPNRGNMCELPQAMYTYESIYALFEKECQFKHTSADHSYCTEAEFRSVWKKCFPHVHIKKWMLVTGKCLFCSYVNEQMLKCQHMHQFKELQAFKEQHRAYVQAEKLVYYNNRRLAEDFPSMYMSLIIDGMQQRHSCIPHFANLKEWAEHVQQHIEGAKQHGFAKTFYRTFQHVRTGGNLAMTCILDEIISRAEYCEENELDFPTILLLQTDGGPENTSKAFLAFCELLLRLNIFDQVYINRLPVGHTHEDIDALFGVLWNYLKFETIYTPKEYEKLVLEAFENNAVLRTNKTDKKNKKRKDRI